MPTKTYDPEEKGIKRAKTKFSISLNAPSKFYERIKENFFFLSVSTECDAMRHRDLLFVIVHIVFFVGRRE